MQWTPITELQLRELVSESVAKMMPETLAAYKKFAIEPYKIPCIRTETAGVEYVYAVAQSRSHIVLFDDVEGDFAVGKLPLEGPIKMWSLYGELEFAIRALDSMSAS